MAHRVYEIAEILKYSIRYAKDALNVVSRPYNPSSKIHLIVILPTHFHVLLFCPNLFKETCSLKETWMIWAYYLW